MRLAVTKSPGEAKALMEQFFPGREYEGVCETLQEALEALRREREEAEKAERVGAKEGEAEEETKAKGEAEKEGKREASREEKEAKREEEKEAKKEAKKEAEGRDTLYILPGRYEENLSITLSHLTLEGAGRELVRIYGNKGGYEILSDGIKRGTFRTQTVFVHGEDICLRNLTIENGAGQGKRAGQAIALYADGDRLCFEGLNLLGHQDTLFCGPLPEKEVEPGGFRGPLEHAPRTNGRQYYKDCRIEGTIDFLFGSATAFFEDCVIVSLDPNAEEGEEPKQKSGERKQLSAEEDCLGYITAPSTPKGQDYGFVFWNCRMESECPSETIYLGRPWREYGQSVFVSCFLGEHIKREGFHDWGKALAHEGSFFAEADSFGPGSAAKEERADFAHILSREEAAGYRRDLVLGNWKP